MPSPGPTPEPALVIERREELVYMICEAAAGAPFELFFQPDYLLPHRRAAWLVISERIGEAAAFADTLSAALPELTQVAASLSADSPRMALGA